MNKNLSEREREDVLKREMEEMRIRKELDESDDDKLDIMKIEMEFHNKAQGIAEGALHKNHVFYPHFRERG